MSLYNMVRGYNPAAALCIGMLKLELGDIARFRDAWLSDDGTQITILTRTGGGNREYYADENAQLQSHPQYIADEDDDFDCTFARFKFAAPVKFHADTAKIAELLAFGGRSADRQGPASALEALEPHETPNPLESNDPRIAEATAAYERIVEALKVKEI